MGCPVTLGREQLCCVEDRSLNPVSERKGGRLRGRTFLVDVPVVDGYGIEIIPNGVDDVTGSRQRVCDPGPHVTGSAKDAVWIRGDRSGKVAEHA